MIVTAFDTETTNLINSGMVPIDKQPEIIEFYGCRVDLTTGEVLAEVDELIKPRRPLTPETTRITGIKEADLADRSPFAAFADPIAALLEGSPGVMAHNLSFDMEMTALEFGRLGRILAWPRRKLCTVERTVHLRGHRMTLTHLHEHLFGEGFPDAHRARVDVQAMVRCAVELHKRGEL